jgi:transcriptional regulator with XRE-family HTH domain
MSLVPRQSLPPAVSSARANDAVAPGHVPTSVAGILGRNLAAARVAAGLTQQELAELALVSRATIVQIEAGAADAKLSTVQQLAGALGVAPSLLLAGAAELRGLASLAAGAGPDAGNVPGDLDASLRQLLASGRSRDAQTAARSAADAARRLGWHAHACVAAAVGAVVIPGIDGIVIAAAWNGRGTPTPPANPAAPRDP